MNSTLKSAIAGMALALLASASFAQELAPLNFDTEKDRIDWSQLEAKFGTFPKIPEGTRADGVSKTLTNEYWRSLGETYEAFGKKAAVIEGQAGVYAAVQRTAGFKATLGDNPRFKIVATVPGNWDRQQSYDAATNILQQNPDLVGFYCNNDGMALSVIEAVKGDRNNRDRSLCRPVPLFIKASR